MKYRLIKTLATTFVCAFFACTSYNSDKANTELIQGKWLLVDVDHSIYDTITVDYSNEQTFLIFEGSKCIQYMPDLNDTLDLTFSIHNFQLVLYKDSIPLSKFMIDTLTTEELILSHEKSERLYKKIR